jgi:hypothetical protein
MIEKSLDHVHRAHVKAFANGASCILESFLEDFSVLAFAPPPVLYIIRLLINLILKKNIPSRSD